MYLVYHSFNLIYVYVVAVFLYLKKSLLILLCNSIVDIISLCISCVIESLVIYNNCCEYTYIHMYIFYSFIFFSLSNIFIYILRDIEFF